ncbi:MAG TPA: efflux RND transporter periplasmic adaptor subunit [Candidatus Binatia bacterium]|nr:efflux RND transporter periplasmic adaptor subunit [Candidatus Binatia bacterium]
MTRGRWLVVAVVAVVALVAAVALRRQASQPAQTAGPAVALATVRYGDYAVVLDESGYAGAPAGTTAQLAFANAGVLGDVYVRVGQRVTAGELLASLDTRALALDAEQARAEAQAAAAGYGGGSVPAAAVTAARERVRAAAERSAADRAAVVRAQRLYDAGVDALKDVEGARAQLAADEAATTTAAADLRAASSQPSVVSAEVRAASARAASADFLLGQGTLIAPTSGYVTAVYHRAGEAVDSTKPIVAIGPPQNEVTLSVPGTDAAQIAVGNPVELRVAGTAGANGGHIIAVVPAVNPQTQTATVVVSAGRSAAVAGTAVRARITVAHVRGLLVPESAIVEDPQKGESVVFVQQRKPDGSATFVQRTVRIAHEDGTTAQIASGVTAGDRIAAQGAFELLAPSGD